jgi:hypothetical protein
MPLDQSALLDGISRSEVSWICANLECEGGAFRDRRASVISRRRLWTYPIWRRLSKLSRVSTERTGSR